MPQSGLGTGCPEHLGMSQGTPELSCPDAWNSLSPMSRVSVADFCHQSVVQWTPSNLATLDSVLISTADSL